MSNSLTSETGNPRCSQSSQSFLTSLADWLADDAPSQEETLGEEQELDQRKSYLSSALATLNDRERRIFEARRLADDPAPKSAIFVGELEVDLPSKENATKVAVATLREREQRIYAEAEVEAAHIRERIQNLLAITYEGS